MPKIALIITGGIAAYKSLYLIRLLRNNGYDVMPIMTKSATEFITPLSVGTLAMNPVHTETFALNTNSEIDHIQISRDVDMVCVAPCTANFIAKVACGIADDLASTVVLGNDKPLLIAPAMNPVMWDNPATTSNIDTLRKRGITIVEPVTGTTACGEIGIGNMAEPETICKTIDTMLHINTTTVPSGDLLGKSFLVTVGGTVEFIDPVRVLTNRSSGLQGFAIAQALASQGAKVTAIVGNVSVAMPSGVIIKKVESCDEMFSATLDNIDVDGAIFCAAVADYKVDNQSVEKIKKGDGTFNLSFSENPDILKTVCQLDNRPKLIIGFSAETQNTVQNATEKLLRKGCDMIVANTVTSNSFGGSQSDAYIIDNNGTTPLGTIPKTKVALDIVDYIKKTLG
jgi:phosphopantothenoylcysteine decarboxylase/phosphopantothenate--cysteine ligase